MKTVKRKKHKEAHREFLNQQIESFLSSGGEITKSVTKKQLYEKYMTSEKWLKKKRHEVYTLRGSKCEICEAKKSIQIHHNNYSRLSDEDVLEDLAEGVFGVELIQMD